MFLYTLQVRVKRKSFLFSFCVSFISFSNSVLVLLRLHLVSVRGSAVVSFPRRNMCARGRGCMLILPFSPENDRCKSYALFVQHDRNGKSEKENERKTYESKFVAKYRRRRTPRSYSLPDACITGVPFKIASTVASRFAVTKTISMR